jgi:hypothetical protein
MIATRYPRLRFLCASILLVLTGSVQATAIGPVEGGPIPQPLPLFPQNNWWNTVIANAPVDPKSTSYIAFINNENGGSVALHPDFGGNSTSSSDPDAIYGYPYIVVDDTQPLVAVQFVYSTQSDGVNHTTGDSYPFYPIPTQAITDPRWIECGDPGNVNLQSSCDRHMFIIDRERKYLYELYNVWYNGTQWVAGSGAFFNMNVTAHRPAGWTSADAAGLAMIPGLVRYDEVYNAYGTNVSSIDHAFRVTLQETNGYVYPASHVAGSTSGALPMGARLRLKSSVNISGYPAQMQKIFQAMKTYGLIVADNGSDMYVSGTYDTNWNNGILNPAFGGLTASDFEVVKLGWVPPLDQLTITPNPVVGGFSATGKVWLTSAAPTGGAVVALSAASGLSVPASVTVPAGSTAATFAVTTTAVTSAKEVTVTASYSNSILRTVVTDEPPPALGSVAVNPATISSGGTATGTVTLSEAAPAGGVVVELVSTNTAAATVPANITVPAGSTKVSFSVTGKAVPSTTTTTIEAMYSDVTKTAVLTVN